MSITRTDARRIALRRIERRAHPYGAATRNLALWLFEFLLGEYVDDKMMHHVLHLPTVLCIPWGLRVEGHAERWVRVVDPTLFVRQFAAHWGHRGPGFPRCSLPHRATWARGVIVRLLPVLAHIAARSALRSYGDDHAAG